MPEIDPSQLFDHFVEAVRLLAASAQEQIDWVDSKNLPISELTLQFSDVYPVFAPRLQENGLITDADVRRLERVKQQYTIWSRISVKTPTVVLA